MLKKIKTHKKPCHQKTMHRFMFLCIHPAPKKMKCKMLDIRQIKCVAGQQTTAKMESKQV